VLDLQTTEWSKLRRGVALVLLVMIAGSAGAGLDSMALSLHGSSAVQPAGPGGAAPRTHGVPGEGSGSALSFGAEPAGLQAGPARSELSPNELYLLARIISAEARGEPFLGQVAVGAVVLNRVESELFPDTLAEVIYEPGQFEPVANGQINLEPTESALEAARLAAAGDDPTGGALYFFRPDRVSNAFLWSRPHKITIGNHRFTA